MKPRFLPACIVIVASVLSLSLSATTARAVVLAGPITNSATRHIYYLLSPTNWPSAEAEAVSLGGHLATVNDAAENTWIFSTFANHSGVARSLWFGLNDAAVEGTWVWVSGDAASYRNWAPGEPNNGGGFFPNEDQAVMRGPAQSYPDSWNDAPSDQNHAAVVELNIVAPPPNPGSFDVAAGFSTSSNPNAVWRYGQSATLGGTVTLFSEKGNWSGLNYWRAPVLLGIPGVYHNPGNTTVTNSTATAVLGPGQLSLFPGANGEYCVVRFSAPSTGQFQVVGAFTGVDPHGTFTDVHIIVNGVIFNGSVNGFGAGSGPAFNLIASVEAGDPIDFVVGRSADSQFAFDSTALALQITPFGGFAPTITVHPQSRTVTAGTNVTFTVTATGTAPLSYQWRRNETNLAGATGSSLTLNNVQATNAGLYSVRVTNAFGSVISSNALLTVLPVSTNCIVAPTGLVSWWRGESNALDSADANHGTVLGNTTFGTGRVGQGFVFDGSGDGVRVGNPTNLQLQNFTIEAWIKRASSSVVSFSLGGAWAEFFCYGGGGYAFGFLGDGRLFLSKVDIDQTQTTVAITDTNLHHVAVTKVGTNVVFYIDGVAYPVPSYNTTYTFTQPAAIGARGDSLTGSFYGAIDELSVYNRALSSSEITAIYAAGGAGKCPPPGGVAPTITSHPLSRTVPAGTNVTFTVTATGTAPLSYQWRRGETNLAGATGPSLTLTNVQLANAGIYSVRVTNAFGTAFSSNATLTVFTPGSNCVVRPAGLVGWWRFEGNANDSAGTNHGTTPEGIGYAAGEVGQAFDFKFLNQYRLVLVPGSPDFVLTNSFAVEGWIYPRQAENGLIFYLGGPGAIRLGMDSSPGNVMFEIWNDAFQSVSLQAPIQTNQWHHIAAMLDGTSGTMTLYVDGVARAQTNTVIRPTLADQLPAIWIGALRGFAGVVLSQFNGLIDELSLYSRALSSNEVHAIYNADGAGKCTDTLAPLIVSHPTNQTVVVGANVTFTVTATGTSPLSYQWRRDGTNVAGATGSSLTLTNVQLTNAGTYSVRVTNAFGVATSSNAVLTVGVAAYDVSGNYSLTANPNGVWRYGALSNLAGPFTLLPSSRTFPANNGVLIGEWNMGGVQPPHVDKVLGPGTAVSEGGAFTGPAGTVYMRPGPEGTVQNFGVIRFTVPVGGAGNYRIMTAVQPLFDGAVSADADFHVTRNGVELFGAALGPNQGTSYSNTLALATGDTIDFAIGRGADGILGHTGLKIQATMAQLTGTVGGVAPVITAHPQNQTAVVGTNVTFTVTATGTSPLSYQWRRGETNLAGATGTSLTLTNVQAANAGTYSVRVTNAFGVATSSNAVLTVTLPIYDVSTNYSLAANPNGVWRYGALSNLAGPLTLLTSARTFGADNGVPIGEWNPGGVLHPHVNKVLGPGTAVSAGGAFVGPAGTIYFTPGEDGTAHNFGAIRFTVPAGGAGNYRIVTAVQPLFDGAVSADADFHVTRNGVELFGAALAPNQGTSYSNTLGLAVGDTIDFAIGRGADGILGTTGLKIQATLAQLNRTSSLAGVAFGVTALAREPGASARLSFAGAAGATYVVQASTNLADWEAIGTSVADDNGFCEFVDPDSARFACRYYRVVAQ